MSGSSLYRSLLCLYPRAFRTDYGDDLVQHFNDLVVDRGPRAAWIRTTTDLIVTVPRYRLESIMGEKASATTLSLTTAVLTLGGVASLIVGFYAGFLLLVAALAVAFAQRSVLARAIRTPGSERRRRRLTIAGILGVVCALSIISYLHELDDNAISGLSLMAHNAIGVSAMFGAVGFLIAGLLTPRTPPRTRPRLDLSRSISPASASKDVTMPVTNPSLAYLECVDRITAMTTASAARVPIQACPPWTAHDLVAHLTGLAEDWIDQNLAGYASAAWTQAQIDRHRHEPIEALVTSWATSASRLVELEPHPLLGTPARWAFGDALIHEADLRESLEDTRQPPTDVVATHLASTIERWASQLETAQLALTITTTDGDCYRSTATPDCKPVGVVATTYELWRAITGRRTRDTFLAMDWVGDAEAVLAVGLPYPFTVPASSEKTQSGRMRSSGEQALRPPRPNRVLSRSSKASGTSTERA